MILIHDAFISFPLSPHTLQDYINLQPVPSEFIIDALFQFLSIYSVPLSRILSIAIEMQDAPPILCFDLVYRLLSVGKIHKESGSNYYWYLKTSIFFTLDPHYSEHPVITDSNLIDCNAVIIFFRWSNTDHRNRSCISVLH
jgi:hypothetical protein